MKKQLKNVRIVTDNGDTLLIRSESLQSLLRSLELLSSNGQSGRRNTTPKKK